MNIRLTEYLVSIMRKHHRQYKELPAILTMVVYAGRALFSINEFHHSILRNHKVLDLTKMSSSAILKNKTISLMLLALKLRAKGQSKEFISILNEHNCEKELDKIDLNPLILYLADDPLTQNRQELLKAFSNQMEASVMESYIRRLVHETEQIGLRKGLAEGKKQGLQEGKQIGMQEGKQIGMQEGKQLGMQEGKQLGMQEGKQLGLREVVYKLLGHMNKKQISQLLSISMDEVEKLCS